MTTTGASPEKKLEKATLYSSFTGSEGPEVLSETEDPLVGLVLLGKIEIQCLIGEGNRARVYKGWHRELQLDVAVKFLHEHFVDSPEKIARFNSEAKIASSLSHSSIVKVFDYGFLDEGQPFIVMEYIPGGTLAQLFASKAALDLQSFYSVFQQIASGLSHAHASGIFHRDVKPENILIVKDRKGNLQPKLADWGLAKVVFSNETNPQFTATGDVMGSPAYMSPEQCSGHKLDAASDVYSTGCVMWEWFAGTQAFTGRNPFDCMRKHLEYTPPPLRAVCADVPEALERLVLKCLKPDPSERIKSASELGSLLEKLARNQFGEVLTELARSKSDLPVKKMSRGAKFGLLLTTLLIVAGVFVQTGIKQGVHKPAPPVVASSNASNFQPSAPLPSLPILKEAASSSKVATNSVSHAERLQDMLYDFQLTQHLLSREGLTADATKAGKTIADAQALYGSGKFPQSSKAELHMVSFDTGEPLKKFDPRGTANVRVSCTHAPIVLILASRDEVRWNVKVDAGVRLLKVYVIGDHAHHVSGVPESIITHLRNQENSYGSIEETGASRLDTLTAALQKQNGIAGLSTWQSALCAGKSVWVVGPQSLDWRAQMILQALKPAHAQALLRMQSNFQLKLRPDGMYVAMPRQIDGVNRYCQNKVGTLILPGALSKFLPGVPANNFVPPLADDPSGFQSNYNTPIEELPGTHQFFYVDFQCIREIDPETSRTEDIPFPPGAETGYGETCIAADENGTGLYFKDVKSLYHLSLPAIKWRKISDLLPPPGDDREILNGLVYSPPDASLYSLYDKLPRSNDGFRYLVRISTKGQVLRRIKLSRRIGTELAGQCANVTLRMAGRYVAAILTSTAPPGPFQFRALCYLIDPSNGAIVLVSPIKLDNTKWKE